MAVHMESPGRPPKKGARRGSFHARPRGPWWGSASGEDRALHPKLSRIPIITTRENSNLGLSSLMTFRHPTLARPIPQIAHDLWTAQYIIPAIVARENHLGTGSSPSVRKPARLSAGPPGQEISHYLTLHALVVTASQSLRSVARLPYLEACSFANGTMGTASLLYLLQEPNLGIDTTWLKGLLRDDGR